MPNLRTNTIVLDVNGSPIKTPVYLTPSDVEAYTLNFKIMNGAIPFDITGATITAIFKVPTVPLPYTAACTIIDAANGLCSYELPSDIYAVVGTVVSVLRIVIGTQQLSTCGFLMQVNSTPDESGGVVGSDHYPVLVSLIADVQAAIISVGDLNTHKNAATLDHPNGSVPFIKLDTNLDNTSDLDKPISTATQAVLYGECAIYILNVTSGTSDSGSIAVVLDLYATYIDVGISLTATQVASAIRVQSFEGWTITGANTEVIFTANAAGYKPFPQFYEGSPDTGARANWAIDAAGGASGKADLDAFGKVPLEQIPSLAALGAIPITAIEATNGVAGYDATQTALNGAQHVLEVTINGPTLTEAGFIKMYLNDIEYPPIPVEVGYSPEVIASVLETGAIYSGWTVLRINNMVRFTRDVMGVVGTTYCVGMYTEADLTNVVIAEGLNGKADLVDELVPVAQLPSVVNYGAIPAAEKGAVNGVATLGADGLVPAAQIPAPTAIGAIDATTPILLGEMDGGEHTIGFTEYDNGNSSTAVTVDWRKSNHQKVTMTDNCTFTFTAPTKPCMLSLRIINDGTAGRTITLPTIKWAGGLAPTWTKLAGAIDILSLYYDGTAYYGQAGLGWA